MNVKRILLADDHALIRAGICNALNDVSGLEIVGEVGDGPSVFASLASDPPDCLVVDVNMPDFEPISAIQDIRSHYPDLKILAISAYDDDFYVQGLLVAGVDGYYLKNESLEDLQLAVERVLAGKKWISSPLVSSLIGYRSNQSKVPSLSSRQRNLLRLLHKGFNNQRIAQELHLSVKTIENNLTRLYRQLGVQSRLEAANYVIEHPDLLIQPAQSEYRQPITTPPISHLNPTVLLVDDNARYRNELRQMISAAFPQAVAYEAENTAEALDWVQRITPHLIFVDVLLGDEDGIQCARRIHALRTRGRIVLISAYPDREFRRLGLEAGAVAFLDKADLQTTTLRRILDDVIQ